MRVRSILRLCISPALLAIAMTSSARDTTRTPEQERLAIVAAIQSRLPDTRPADWIPDAMNFGVSGRQPPEVRPFNLDNATNSADVLGIGRKLWERKFSNGRSLSNCFPNAGKKAATGYPQFDSKLRR
ncbi:MAG: hypothetical protein H7X76_07690, partial [Prolixibacteraceae bacterium]|nr:hypothetical protein [Burkholderiales bacterium]